MSFLIDLEKTGETDDEVNVSKFSTQQPSYLQTGNAILMMFTFYIAFH